MSCHLLWRLKFSRSIVIAGSALASIAAAQSSLRHISVTIDLQEAKLAFSGDGRTLHAVGQAKGDLHNQHVCAITYDAETGAIVHTIHFARGTTLLSLTSDGRTAVLAESIEKTGQHAQLLLADTENGKSQPLPSNWYMESDNDPDVRISGDGKLISVYSESGAAPMNVSVYGWPDKTFVAKRTSDYIGAGGAFGGGITEDGHAVAFENNRTGTVLVDLKTGRELARFGPDTVRSMNGAWAVEMPNLSFQGEDAPREVLIKDGNTGKVQGKIRVPVPDEIAYGQMTGAFCGDTRRFLLAAGATVAIYTMPSGLPSVRFPVKIWQDPASPARALPACSSTATHVAILSGSRLTFYVLK